MKILITFNYTEKMRLLNHASSVLHGGHWGSSDLIIPEQQELLKILENMDGPLELSIYFFKMLIDWIYEGTHEGTLQLPEDIIIINKLSGSLKICYENKKEKYISELKELNDMDEILSQLLNKNNESFHSSNQYEESAIKDNQNIILNELKSINQRLDCLEDLISNALTENGRSRKVTSFKSITFFFKNLSRRKNVREGSQTGYSKPEPDSDLLDSTEYLKRAEKQARLLKKKGIKI